MTEKTGAVKVRRTDGTVVTAGSFAVDSDSEKGLLGVERDPQFQSNGYLYFYASDGPSTANKHRVLRVVLSHRRITLGITVATVAATVALYVVVPKGLFPQQDTGVLAGFSEHSARAFVREFRLRKDQLR